MIELALTGIGTGNPEHLTLQAIGALNCADVIPMPRKGADKTDLADLRCTICAGHLNGPAQLVAFVLPIRGSVVPRYPEGAQAWNAAIAAAYRPQGGRVPLPVWGDPSRYDSSLRIAALLGKKHGWVMDIHLLRCT